ncbi:MAG TPA: hypothetical protein DD441_15285 [Parabacteroides distasonis]|nr:hypothetical protein [Parabacteroides distasonis]
MLFPLVFLSASILTEVLTDELLIYYFSINTPACSTIAVYLKNLSPHGNFRIINIFLKEEMGDSPIS